MREGSELVSVKVFDKDPWCAGGKVKHTRSKRGHEVVMTGCLFFRYVYHDVLVVNVPKN